VGGARRFTAVDAGTLHSCAVDTSGRAFCWGNNSFGQLGITSLTDQPAPVAVNTARTFGAIAAGRKETCAVDGSGQGFCWGAAQGPTVTPISGFIWRTLVPNDDHRCGVTTAGGGYCWGHEDYGELGDGGTHQDTRGTPTALAPIHGVDLPPVAKIVVTGCTNLACTFNGTLSTDDFGIVSWTWTFGDGSTGSGSIANHTYPTSGTYSVTLTVADGAGQTSSTSQSVTVFYNPPANQTPVARFTVSCTAGQCVLDAGSSSDDQGIASYSWKPAVSSRPTKTGVRITRYWQSSGVNSYQETLTVTDGGGLQNSVTKTITIPHP
jgi:hypothetical protein